MHGLPNLKKKFIFFENETWGITRKKNNDKLFHKVTLLHISCFKLLVLFNRRHYLLKTHPPSLRFYRLQVVVLLRARRH